MEKNSFRVRKTFAMTTELIPVYYFRFGMRKDRQHEERR
jgi:hypothetical protein